MEKLSYLKPADQALVREAFQFSDEAHLGQYRQSGEPYITHPVAVAELCADWRLDVQSIMAALLHDVMEDRGVTKGELAERFGPKVAELVDGLTKLDKLEFQSREQAQAESFRKMLLAMARDVRVIPSSWPIARTICARSISCRRRSGAGSRSRRWRSTRRSPTVLA